MRAAFLITATGEQQVKLAAVDALVPLSGMGMFVSDSITAVLLFTKFSTVRSCIADHLRDGVFQMILHANTTTAPASI
ncbi:hypothetical protein BSZ16_12505 [Bradyrhizobium canariense]|nr:hypothetical protein BSZ16_12505 [Bradyrhizobium canariense]